MIEISSTEIEQWADRRSSQGHLPLLIRKLILATIGVDAIEYINFPSGDDIGKPGFDGKLITKSSNIYVPLGTSFWEVSTQDSVTKKANSDYAKRTDSQSDLSQFTYVFISARAWSSKEEWTTEKNMEGKWKEVKAYDASNLQAWISMSLPTTLWFGELIGRPVSTVIALERYAKDWLSPIKLPHPFELALGGRDKTRQFMSDFLSRTEAILRIRALTKDEAVVFIYAAFMSLDNELCRQSDIDRAIVVMSSESLKHYSIKEASNLIIIPIFNNLQDIVYQDEHKYIIPLDYSNPPDKNAHLLSRISTQSIQDLLKNNGYSDIEATGLARNSGGYITILRRLKDRYYLPEWARNNQSMIRQIIPILLTQYCETKHSGDCEAISQLAGTTWEEYENRLTLLLNCPDRPICKVGRLWIVNSALDCYFSFITYITRRDWDEFQKVVVQVFRDRNPELDLEPEKRCAATLYDKSWKYSEDFRRGLAQSLIMISVYGDYSQTYPNNSNESFVDQIVEHVFHAADPDRWYSLGSVMPLLAEASPGMFIKAVESSLSSYEKSIMGMFTESGDFFTSRSEHHNLLWALEALSWDARYFKRSVTALCKLALLDPGGRVSNRPFYSLTSIFRLWMPQTEAPTDVRFKVLEDVTQAYPDLGWNLLTSLLPKAHDSGSYTYRYKWRELSCQEVVKISTSEWNDNICRLVDMIIPILGISTSRWVEMLDHYPNLPDSCKNSLIEYLNSKLSELNDPESTIANRLRSIISHHRTYRTAEWAMQEEIIKSLEDLFRQLEPASAMIKYKYLFNEQFPDLIDGRSVYKEDGDYLKRLRITAYEELKEEIGFQGIFELSNEINFPYLLAEAATLQDISDNLVHILKKLESEGTGEKCFSQKLLRKGQKEFGEPWAEAIIDDAIKGKWGAHKLINLLLSFPSERWLWNIVEKMDPQVEIQYWQKADVYHYNMQFDDVRYVIDKLCESHRNYVALRMAQDVKNTLPVADIVRVLEITATTKCSEEVDNMVSYDAEDLLEIVQAASDVDLVTKKKLEWQYIPVLTSLNSRIGPRNLHNDMSSNPSVFVDVLSMVYRPRYDDPEQKDEAQDIEDVDAVEVRVAENAYALLNSWHLIPSMSSDGTIDMPSLINWIDNVILLAKQKGFHEVALCKIGEVLSYCPTEADGQWPCNSICEVLEYYKDDRIDLNFRIGVHNQRGTTVRGMYDGGKQERTLIEKYKRYASQVVGTYPRVSDILNDIANDFERDAKREDEEAEKNRIKYG